MPKNQVNDPITDQEMAFADLVLSGTMTDCRAAQAAGLNPATAAYTKAKPRVRDYMLKHRADVHERLLQQEAEEARRLNLGRERVLARLWEIADLDPEATRNSMSAQIKALSMIVAIEALIPDRRAASWAKKSAAPQPSPDLVRDDAAGPPVDAPSDPGPTPGPDSESIVAHPVSAAEPALSSPYARVPDSAAKPSGWRLRL
jgi:hypothetical protein